MGILIDTEPPGAPLHPGVQRDRGTSMQSIVERFPDQARTREACRYVLRLIRSGGLVEGDRLPTQEELRLDSGYAHDTLSKAMQALVQAGVLTRKPRVGTLVLDPDALQEKLWTVGLTFPHRVVSGYFAMLQALTTQALQRRDCWCRTYLCAQHEWPGPRGFTVDCFPGLAADLQTGRVDAVLSLLHVDMPDVEVSAAGNRSTPSSCYHDHAGYCREAAELLHRRGCSRLMVVQAVSPEVYQEDVAQQLHELGYAMEIAHDVTQIEDGMDLGRALLARPARQRPDGLIALTDHAAMGLCSVLATSDYRPDVTVLTHPQLRQVYAMPVFRWEVDIHELADCAAAMLVDRLMAPGLPTRQVPIRATLVEGGPRP